jgi:phage shock protein A
MLMLFTFIKAFTTLQMKLEEARAKSELLMAQHRRARTLTKAADAHSKIGDHSTVATFDRMKEKVMRSEAIGQAKTELIADRDNLDDRFAQLEKEDEVNRILGELKARRQA